MSDTRPIGVFDSGIGGLTVVKAMRDLLPNESISYLGDTARVPYGPKSAETVQRYAIELAEMLIKEDAKALVVACNTVSSVALPALTQKFLAAEIVTGNAFVFAEPFLDRGLRSNAGVIHPR